MIFQKTFQIHVFYLRQKDAWTAGRWTQKVPSPVLYYIQSQNLKASQTELWEHRKYPGRDLDDVMILRRSYDSNL